MHHSVLRSIIIDCNDLEVGVEFWSKALGVGVAGKEDEDYVILEKEASGLEIGLQLVPEPKTAKSRIHLDISSDNMEAEVQRLEKLGARRIEKIESWWVMQDPSGNEFCVLSSFKSDLLPRAKTWE